MKKVFVGMSGGVDSSVTAALLKKEGLAVTGVFIRVWEPPNFPCTWRDDRRDAMRVAAKLNIPFLTLDLSEAYKKEVVDYMVGVYRSGLTPNPDIMCNKAIKFGGFFNWAISQGADYVATGHYAHTEGGKLFSGLDSTKDQSYFLWTLTTSVLEKTIFPLGNLTKAQVRQLAEKFALPTADKKDSQGLCFIGKIDIKEFLSNYIEFKTGAVLNEAGEVIGQHDGVYFYTLGQRHGFKVNNIQADNKPLYIVARDLKNNTITVNHKKGGDNARREIPLGETNWIKDKPQPNVFYQARFRHLGELVPCHIELEKNQLTLTEPKADIASGQSVVIYKEREVLGGGVIA